MPELPEVEIIRTSLARDCVGRKFKLATVTTARCVKRNKNAKDFKTLLEGHSVKAVQRLGLNVLFALDNGTTLVIDLGSSAQLLRCDAKTPKIKNTHVVLSFTQGPELRLIDASSDSELYVSTPPGEGVEVEISKFARLSVGGDGLALRKQIAELAGLGVDPLEDQIGWDRFAAIIRSRSTALKAVLTDPAIFSGIGDMYADEMLYAAALMGDRESESLSTIEIRRLHRAIFEILNDALKHGGTTLEGGTFSDPDGKAGSYQTLLQVYGREGLPCFQCRQPIVKGEQGQRSTYFCPKCQG